MYTILVLLFGFIAGYFVRSVLGRGLGEADFLIPKKEQNKESTLIKEQKEEKGENLLKVLEYFSTQKEVSNDEIEKLLGVSDSTATRYLNELEEKGKVRRIGDEGRFVYYTQTK